MDDRPAQQSVADNQVKRRNLGCIQDVGTAKTDCCIESLFKTVSGFLPKDPFASGIMGKATLGGSPGLQRLKRPPLDLEAVRQPALLGTQTCQAVGRGSITAGRVQTAQLFPMPAPLAKPFRDNS